MATEVLTKATGLTKVTIYPVTFVNPVAFVSTSASNLVGRTTCWLC